MAKAVGCSAFSHESAALVSFVCLCFVLLPSAKQVGKNQFALINGSSRTF